MQKNKGLKLVGALLFTVSSMMHGNSHVILQNISGVWLLDRSQSRHADFFDGADVLLKISRDGENRIKIKQESTTEYAVTTTASILDMNGVETISKWPKGDLPMFGFEAVAIADSQDVGIAVQKIKSDSSFDVIFRLNVLVSQGYRQVFLKAHYELKNNGSILQVSITRESRKDAEPVVYVFKRLK
ncbi:MAG: hypothetical protein ACP5US_11825 [Candidatus Kryptoniota bacterium]